MLNFIKTFRADEDGAVTVDWVVLTAAVVGLGMVVFSQITSQTKTLSDDIATGIGSVTVGTME